MQKKGHSGILYRGANGDLWFLRDDYETPRAVNNARLKRLFSAHAKGAAPSPLLGRDLPEDILDILDDLFGPLIGAWWVWGGP